MQAPLKASGWWNYKIPPLLGVAYYALASAPAQPAFADVAWLLLAWLAAVIGIAGFGHVLLDAFDVEEDRLLGKSNLWAPLSNAGRVALLVLLLAASWLPWLVLPAGTIVLALVALEFVMFFLYAVPPVRLKERGLPGILADAMYAHALPALWTWIPLSIIAGNRTFGPFPVVLGIWSFSVGVRHLMQHQAIQLDSDRVANARTYAVRRGRRATLATVMKRVMPLEAVAFVLLLAVVSSSVPLLAAGFAVYATWQVFKFRFLWIARPSLARNTPQWDRVTIAGTLLLTRFYERWLPLLLLLTLVSRSPSYLPLLFIHLIVFRAGFAELIKEDIPLVTAYFRSRRKTNQLGAVRPA